MPSGAISEIRVDCPGGTLGKHLVQIIERLELSTSLPVVVVADIECNENREWVGIPPFATTTHNLITYAKSVGQFDWATFFLFAENTQFAIMPDFGTLFLLSPLVIRAIDGEYYLIYTTPMELAAALASDFVVSAQRVHTDTLKHPF